MPTHDLTKPPALGHDPENLIVAGHHALLVAPAEAASLDDWDLPPEIEPTPDVGWLSGRYVHAGKPPNRNGLAFRPHELPTAIRRVLHKPLDMIHDPRRIIGTHAAQRMLYPNGAPAEARVRSGQAPYTDTPYSQVMAAVWSYHYSEEAELVAAAYNDGKAFLSMSCLPASVQCDRCGHIAPWDGYTSDLYCEHMQGLNFKWVNDPLFLGGAVIIPPINPGWSRAAITKLRGFLDVDDDISHLTYAGVAALAGHASTTEVELLTAKLISASFNDDPTVAGVASRKIAVLAGHTLDAYEAPAEVIEAVRSDLERQPEPVAMLALAAPVDRHQIEAIVDADPNPASAWATQVWRSIVARDLEDMAPGSSDQKRIWAQAGIALDDGSFPIPNVRWIRKALLAWARVSAPLQARVKRHILTRARALEAPDDVIARIEQLGPPVAQAAEQTGAIVALRPPAEIAEQLAAAGTEPADEIHLTLAFLGDVDGDTVNLDGTTATRDQVLGAVAAWATTERALMAAVSGRGTFVQADQEVTYASVDAPGLAELRTRLVAALEAATIPVSVLHGFTPHVTVAYHEPGAGPDNLPSGLSWHVNTLEIWWGGEHHEVQLG